MKLTLLCLVFNLPNCYRGTISSHPSRPSSSSTSYYSNDFPSEVPAPGASASPEILREIQMLEPHPRPTESEPLGVELGPLCFNKPSWTFWCVFKCKGHCSNKTSRNKSEVVNRLTEARKDMHMREGAVTEIIKRGRRGLSWTGEQPLLNGSSCWLFQPLVAS